MSIKAGVVGAAGFAGIELCRILLRHPEFELAVATSDANEGTPIASMYPAFAGQTDLEFTKKDNPELLDCQIAFLAVPHTAAIAAAPALIEAGVTVVDLSADFRLADPKVYEKWYKVEHTATDLLAQRAFGLPELFPEDLAAAAEKFAAGEAALVGCAGCYPTATSLAAAPAIRAGLVDPNGIVIADAVSGVTGAGKKCSERTHYCFANENAEAYGVGTHRHTPEIEQILGIQDRLVFTPHLVPLNRGILSTVTMPLVADKKELTREELEQVYLNFYQDADFVQVLPGGQPRTASVSGTNRAQIGVTIHPTTRMIIATGAIDNLCKGAAGQAVQCANIVCGLAPTAGLDMIPCAI